MSFDGRDAWQREHLRLLATVAAGRPVWMPTFCYGFTRHGTFDLDTEPSEVGVLTERFRQMVARPGEEAAILGELVGDAARCGTVALKGRLGPELDLALRDVRCTFEHGPCLLIHAREGAVYEAFASDRAVLTPLDGEAWISAAFPGAVA